MFVFVSGLRKVGILCREGSQAKIMAILKTYILPVQFKLLISKEGHLIF